LPNPKKLAYLDIANNNIDYTSIDFLKPFANLDTVILEAEDSKKKFHNRFFGSLESLKDMEKLRVINISNTDLDGGLEYLPVSVIDIRCSSKP